MKKIVLQKSNSSNAPCCLGLWHLLAGALMIILGIYVWFNPLLSLIALSLYIGAALIIIGAGYVTSSLSVESGWFMFVGIIDIIIGIVLMANIGITASTLPIIFGLWCLVVGAVQLVSSYHFIRRHQTWGWSMALGLLGLCFGFLVLYFPAIGVVTISTLLGLYIILYGILEIAEYFYFRSRAHLNSIFEIKKW